MEDMNEALELVYAPLYLAVLVVWGMGVIAFSPIWVPVMIWQAWQKRQRRKAPK